MTKRIGILGGTFNPIHVGHLAIAQKAQEKLGLEKVIFVPSCQPPHKKISNLASAKDRYHMVQLAIKDNPLFEISNFEFKKGGKSYSVDTVKYFYDKFSKGTRLFFIIGEDSLPGLGAWRQVDEILKVVSFVVVNRPRFGGKDSPVKHASVAMPGIDVSSSYLRRRIVQGKTIKYLVPEKVLGYIEKHKLYHL
ncbi:MAG: nicotinate-nucleotide adenylyltransferase [Candidatus Omnitrophica bacterium]|nr:nicotinate-nucleotide adenylyltransferase [Candidatus Omnitrophota bacterium]